MVNWLSLPLSPRMMNRASGFVSNGAGLAEAESFVAELVIAVILGGFAGMVGGILLSNVLRGMSLHSIRPYTGTPMILATALLGAVMLPVASWLSEQED